MWKWWQKFIYVALILIALIVFGIKIAAYIKFIFM